MRRTADNILKSWYRNKNKRNTAELDESLSDGSWEARELSLLNSNYRHAMVAYYIVMK